MKDTMKIKAKATWNDKIGYWEVSLKGKDTCGKFKRLINRRYAVAECDEVVIPTAILTENGIDTTQALHLGEAIPLD